MLVILFPSLRLKDKAATKEDPTKKKSADKETSISYSCPENPNISFTILPSVDNTTFPAFKPFLDHVKVENFDAFLLFTAEKFSNRHFIFAKAIKSIRKPFFFIRTMIDQQAEKQGKESSEEKMLLERKASLAKDFNSDESEMYLISNSHPQKWDFPKLTKAIVDALPAAQKKSFFKISKVQKLIKWSDIQTFLKGNAEKMMPCKKGRNLQCSMHPLLWISEFSAMDFAIYKAFYPPKMYK